jgi:hypothetical protein
VFEGGLLSKLQDDDVIRVDAISGTVMCLEDPDIINARLSSPQPNEGERGCGRELFAINRDNISNAEQGASYLFPLEGFQLNFQTQDTHQRNVRTGTYSQAPHQVLPRTLH